MSLVVGLVLLFAIAVPLVLWLGISRETSDPTVVDRAEAERIAKERGGLDPTRSRSPDGQDTTALESECDGWGGRPGDGTDTGDAGWRTRDEDERTE
ncbi:hypothetical protein [Natrinema salifodinae]|uniref:Uncharacterized protein n=1 Tax=Natrinema salifodinae TaxID=1202768 RepID=A0A1I0PR06_9EURY|nr:hypothetical protein [Natrinema salifodinae]SEW16722.1 hypothetical protein SAMN05216285_2832 [Natrinema salifodinae]